VKKISCTVRVKNPLGLHTRPATEIVKMLQNRRCQVFFTHRREKINAKSIMGILMLSAHRNSKITIDVEGEEAEETMELLIKAFEKEFEEA
jgi:phosphocarrier protein HPr